MGIEPGHRQTPDDQSATTTPTPRWWVAEGLRDDLCAVFEGGGAKGVAHAGAAWAVHGRGHWFRAVAGASAGAITAALVAAGATPAQLDAWTPEGLAALGRLDQGGDGLRPAELLLSYTHDEIEHVLATRRVAGTVRVAGAAPYLLDVLSDTSAVAAFRTTRRPLAEPARSAVDALERRSRPGLSLLLQGMSTLANPFVALAMVAASAVSAAVIARWAFAARPGGVWVIAWVLALVVLLTVLAAATVLYAVLVTANVALHWPTRKYGTLVARAYAAASGAPYWSGRPGDGPDDGVIRLPIPPWATTLAFDLDETRRRDLIGTARRVTTERLAVLLPGTE